MVGAAARSSASRKQSLAAQLFFIIAQTYPRFVPLPHTQYPRFSPISSPSVGACTSLHYSRDRSHRLG